MEGGRLRTAFENNPSACKIEARDWNNGWPRDGPHGGTRHSRIPTGFRLKAQGCRDAATLGRRPRVRPNRNAVVASSCVVMGQYSPKPRWGFPR